METKKLCPRNLSKSCVGKRCALWIEDTKVYYSKGGRPRTKDIGGCGMVKSVEALMTLSYNSDLIEGTLTMMEENSSQLTDICLRIIKKTEAELDKVIKKPKPTGVKIK